ncbi:MAG: hypothetical protein COU09_00060 [Candidatus Harrisonbacteria bacterium CG10_big_fil_rev_8_21_14_0_10_44_23]|uniref:Peptidoglycan binding-like domain-containing protein n=1 Tax=Candidatus Harrisonbacteria bacterium CG10_big_fil_rev_8_21_14_0_10_44_23 TaxID=1974585 RepID=A0A2H0UQY4_9BACT|nr:MAG: hypothetical protein COU09_00060 [Candidatus Harrisonbacteria bacterium CG10_big_fil_rev_8_21_14_0_10_44_23]
MKNTYGYTTFGCQSLRISNAVTSGSFGDQTFAAPLSDSVGEADATTGSFSEGTRYNHYEAQFDIASTKPDEEQSGLFLSVSPDRGDGSRMSYLSFADTSGGIQVTFYDVQGTDSPANFADTDLGTLDRTVSHTIKFEMDTNDDPSNDVVKIYIDGSLVHTGTTWENYYRYDSEASAEQSPRIVKTLIFRASGTAAPANDGMGFLLDNMSLSASNAEEEADTGAIQITKYICPDETSVNRDDNGLEGSAPEECELQSGAYFGYAHGENSETGAPYDDFGYPLTAGGSTDENGVMTISDLDPSGRYVIFETDSENNKFGNDDLLGLYCEGDGDPDPNHNDNGDITFVTAGETSRCVAYNPGLVEEVATVSLCKIDRDENPLDGWMLFLKGDEVDEIEVPSENSTGEDSISLTSGISYIFNAFGTWLNDREPDNYVDADYSTEDNWETQMDGFTGYGEDILDLQIDEQFVDWGEYNSGHSYVRSFVPDSNGAVNFRVFDGQNGDVNESWYGDNEGSLTVGIAKGFAGVTDDGGCIEFEDVPYGDYEVGEINQSGWENVSGLDVVTVDDESETFYVVNRDLSISEIIQPEVDEETSGTTELEAYYADENGDGNDSVQWAVRAGTCAVGTNTVLGNVDGHNDLYTWDGMDFSADFDTTQVDNGEYCFVFNPSEDSGDENQRLTREFTVNNEPGDDDGDGVPNDSDECAETPAETEVDKAGCPFEEEQTPAFECSAGILHQNIVSGDPKTKLYSVDPDTLAFSDAGQYSNDYSNNVAVDADGIVYSIDDADMSLYVLNADGTRELVGATGIKNRVPASGFGPDGLLYVIEKTSSDGDGNLYSIDPGTGSATFLYELSDVSVNGGDLVVNGEYKVIYIHVDGEVWEIDLLDGYNEISLGFLDEGMKFTGLALVDGVYYATEKNTNSLYSFDLSEGFEPLGSGQFDGHSVYSGDAASCPAEAVVRNEIFGFKYHDQHTPYGSYDEGLDAKLSNWPIRLYGDEGLIEEQETAEDGSFSFKNLTAGVYKVCEVESVDEVVDWFQTGPAGQGEHVVSNGGGENDEGYYCYQYGLDADETISGLAFGNSHDSNIGQGGGHSSRRSSGNEGGSVLGASTSSGDGVVAGASDSCFLWLPEYIKDGEGADPSMVKRLQLFLNYFEGESLDVNGLYNQVTINAVKRFQLKHRDEILAPWNLLIPTGWTWLTTTHLVNGLFNGCTNPLPQLTPFR